MISMPDRTDKRDARAVLAELTGFRFTYMPGVDGASVPAVSLPFTMNQKSGAIGCWRAHMNVLQHIVTNRIATTLIVEDDIDWDVALKVQLASYAEGSRYILNSSVEQGLHSPYGDGWDMLWIGHCGSDLHPKDNRLWVIDNDPTVPPEEELWSLNRPDMSPFGRQTRLVFRTLKGWCTGGYAMTLQGAEKALYRLSMMPNNAPVDVGYLVTCANDEANFTCISSQPSVMGYYRDAGSTTKDSDINSPENADQVRENGMSVNTVFSARLNIESLWKKNPFFRSSYPHLTGEQMHIDEIARAAADGHAEMR